MVFHGFHETPDPCPDDMCRLTVSIADVPELTGEGQALHSSYVRLEQADSVSEGMWRARFSLAQEPASLD
jgi:hypothetical protein